MADKTPVKKAESFREQSAKKRDEAKQPRRLKQASSTVKKPVNAARKLVAAILKPLGFLLIPFKTRPVRFVGRVLSKVLFISYLRGSWQELRSVDWPNFRLTVKLTIAVVIFALVFSLMITSVDYGLDKLFRKVIL